MIAVFQRSGLLLLTTCPFRLLACLLACLLAQTQALAAEAAKREQIMRREVCFCGYYRYCCCCCCCYCYDCYCHLMCLLLRSFQCSPLSL
jgi:hypothetical protein